MLDPMYYTLSTYGPDTYVRGSAEPNNNEQAFYTGPSDFAEHPRVSEPLLEWVEACGTTGLLTGMDP